jgi:hypothetical protein
MNYGRVPFKHKQKRVVRRLPRLSVPPPAVELHNAPIRNTKRRMTWETAHTLKRCLLGLLPVQANALCGQKRPLVPTPTKSSSPQGPMRKRPKGTVGKVLLEEEQITDDTLPETLLSTLNGKPYPGKFCLPTTEEKWVELMISTFHVFQTPVVAHIDRHNVHQVTASGVCPLFLDFDGKSPPACGYMDLLAPSSPGAQDSYVDIVCQTLRELLGEIANLTWVLQGAYGRVWPKPSQPLASADAWREGGSFSDEINPWKTAPPGTTAVYKSSGTLLFPNLLVTRDQQIHLRWVLDFAMCAAFMDARGTLDKLAPGNRSLYCDKPFKIKLATCVHHGLAAKASKALADGSGADVQKPRGRCTCIHTWAGRANVPLAAGDCTGMRISNLDVFEWATFVKATFLRCGPEGSETFPNLRAEMCQWVPASETGHPLHSREASGRISWLGTMRPNEAEASGSRATGEAAHDVNVRWRGTCAQGTPVLSWSKLVPDCLRTLIRQSKLTKPTVCRLGSESGGKLLRTDSAWICLSYWSACPVCPAGKTGHNNRTRVRLDITQAMDRAFCRWECMSTRCRAETRALEGSLITFKVTQTTKLLAAFGPTATHSGGSGQ